MKNGMQKYLLDTGETVLVNDQNATVDGEYVRFDRTFDRPRFYFFEDDKEVGFTEGTLTVRCNLDDEIYVQVAEGTNNNRWESTYFVEHPDNIVSGYIPNDDDKLLGNKILVTEGLDMNYYKIQTTIKEWLTIKKAYYEEIGIGFKWMELIK